MLYFLQTINVGVQAFVYSCMIYYICSFVVRMKQQIECQFSFPQKDCSVASKFVDCSVASKLYTGYGSTTQFCSPCEPYSMVVFYPSKEKWIKNDYQNCGCSGAGNKYSQSHVEEAIRNRKKSNT